jgi:holin-like protein
MGMLLLLGLLLGRGHTPTPVRQTAESLLRYLALLYVPAGVGLMIHLDLIARDWLALLLALFISTVMAMTVTALVLKAFVARAANRKKG